NPNWGVPRANQARSENSGLRLMSYLPHPTTSLDSIKGVAIGATQPELTRTESIVDGVDDCPIGASISCLFRA
ncbi:hypothetical protein, partial [Leptolyngbya sp. Heron Island J]|uniref:hypothetical protein n=1 Tax=Leptolyngbya sp. Heron Island J TaxID=1385935 RepID=UPI001F24A84E